MESLVLFLYEIGAVQIGNFTLHSGRQSPIYIDLRILASFPDALRRTAAAYRTILESLDFDLLAATPLAGLPIGTAISLDMNIPLIYPRQTAKGHGTKKRVEGKWLSGQTAVLIDDLITSGDSLLQTFTVLASEGISASKAVVLIDRNQGGRETLEDQGFLLSSVMNIDQLLVILESQGHITSQQRANILETLQ
jgi:uridine monophosphate synthetase